MPIRLKAVYTIPELAHAAGISRYRMGRLLISSGLQVQRSGRARLILLTELQRALPDLWKSIEQAQAASR